MENKNRKDRNTIIIILSMFISFICGTLGSYLVITNVPSVSKSIIENVSKVELTENSIAISVEKAYDCVLTVVSYKNGQKISTGSGFIYKKDNKVGYIMTNNHVVDGADSVKVILSNNETVEAKILGKETYSDIAVLSIPEDKALSVAEIGDNEKMKLGDTVFTIGAPMGEEYSGTVTKGIISGKDRLVEVSLSGTTSDYYMKVLQTDTALNPGNSGGPLCNVNGEVIGVNSLKLTQDTSGTSSYSVEGMGFAIPIEDALYYAETIEKGEGVKRPYIGVSMLDITNSYYLWQAKITLPNNVDYGVAVVDVESSSPAEKAGIKKGDIITKIENNDITSVAKLRYELYKHSPGDKITVTYNRNGKELKTEVTLEASK